MSDLKVNVDEVQQLVNELDLSFAKLETVIKKPIKNEKVFIEQLKLRKAFTDWTRKKFNLQRESSPDKVYKRDIFYCELGFNIGSEQKEKRPVVILQNDRGNSSSSTTIVAPITTHQDCSIYTEDGKKYYKFTNHRGEDVVKKLDYYEIPLELEANSKVKIKGFINLAQIRTISKKRLSKTHVAKITEENDLKIKNSINRLLFT